MPICPDVAPFTVRTQPVLNGDWVSGGKVYLSLCLWHWSRAMVTYCDATHSVTNPPLYALVALPSPE